MRKQLIIVLPLHNQERQIRSVVTEVLDLAVQLHVDMLLVVVDDGSVDDTYETACELASCFPQVLALRQPVRRGLGAVADLVRQRTGAEMIILHDGVSPIYIGELRELMLQDVDQPLNNARRTVTPRAALDASGSRRFGAVRTLHDTMERAHRRLTGFSWLKLDEQPVVPRRRQVIEQNTSSATPLPIAVATTLLPNLAAGSMGSALL